MKGWNLGTPPDAYANAGVMNLAVAKSNAKNNEMRAGFSCDIEPGTKAASLSILVRWWFGCGILFVATIGREFLPGARISQKPFQFTDCATEPR